MPRVKLVMYHPTEKASLEVDDASLWKMFNPGKLQCSEVLFTLSGGFVVSQFSAILKHGEKFAPVWAKSAVAWFWNFPPPPHFLFSSNPLSPFKVFLTLKALSSFRKLWIFLTGNFYSKKEKQIHPTNRIHNMPIVNFARPFLAINICFTNLWDHRIWEKMWIWRRGWCNW